VTSTALARAEAAFQSAQRHKRNVTLLGAAILLACLLISAWMSEFSPATLWAGLPRIGEYFARILPTLHWAALFANAETEGSLAFWFYRLDSWALLIFETANMAALATLMGATTALLLAFPASRNLSAPLWVFQLCRRFLEALRTVPEIVTALILVWAFGIGALAGILAIAIHTTGALGKLFAEAIENAEAGPWDGVVSAGGTWAEACRFAILPQVLPNILSYALLRFEINLRSASVIGFVGAGGIGEELYTAIASNYYQEISAILLLLILCVAAIDLMSERIRHRVIGAMA